MARQDDTERHHGAVFRVQESVFAPPVDLLIFVRPGAFNPAIFRTMYLTRLREVWQRDPEAFLGLTELAGGGAASPAQLGAGQLAAVRGLRAVDVRESDQRPRPRLAVL